MAEPMSDLELVIAEYRKQLASKDAQLMKDVVGQYSAVERKLLAELALLDETLDGVEPTLAQEVRRARLEILIDQTRTELERITRGVITDVENQQEARLIDGSRHAQVLMGLELPVRLQGVAAQELMAAFQPQSPVATLFQKLPAVGQAAIRDALVQGIALGVNPRVTARAVRQALGGTAARSLTIARTETMRAYRSGTLQTYQANDDLYDRWIWISGRDKRTCAFCWANHGTEFPLTEPMASHPNCRCSMAPRAASAVPSIRTRVVSGAESFAELSQAQQRQILGPSKFAAYSKGDIALDDLAGWRMNPVWGMTGYERSLSEALANPVGVRKPTKFPFPMEGAAFKKREPGAPKVSREEYLAEIRARAAAEKAGKPFSAAAPVEASPEPTPIPAVPKPKKAKNPTKPKKPKVIELEALSGADNLDEATAEILGQLKEQNAAWTTAITPRDKSTIEYYTSHGSTPMNQVLRGTWDKSIPVPAETKRAVTSMTQIVERSTLPDSYRVYRGALLPESVRKQLVPGASFVDKGFMSTSMNKQIATGVAGKVEDSVLFDLTVPAGSKAAFVGINSQYDYELELLIQQGARVNIESVTQADGRTVVRGTVDTSKMKTVKPKAPPKPVAKAPKPVEEPEPVAVPQAVSTLPGVAYKDPRDIYIQDRVQLPSGAVGKVTGQRVVDGKRVVLVDTDSGQQVVEPGQILLVSNPGDAFYGKRPRIGGTTVPETPISPTLTPGASRETKLLPTQLAGDSKVKTLNMESTVTSWALGENIEDLREAVVRVSATGEVKSVTDQLAARILMEIDQGKVQPLNRGMSISAEDAAKLVVGGTLDVPISSWSKAPNAAYTFALAGGMNKVEEGTPVVLRVNTQGWDIVNEPGNEDFKVQQEVITAGKFEIARIYTEKSTDFQAGMVKEVADVTINPTEIIVVELKDVT